LRPMANVLAYPTKPELGHMNWAELVSACARDRGNSDLWAEFLARYGLKIKQFVQGAWQLSLAQDAAAALGELHPPDLFQTTIVRLVEKDCAAMKRFSGTTEDQWLAYLAVIAKSVVRDALRRLRTLKRTRRTQTAPLPAAALQRLMPEPEDCERPALERAFLAQEVRQLCERAIHNLGNETSMRDLLIFRLYYDHNLPSGQIARCEGINLTKAGVEMVLNRLRDRIRSMVSPDAPVKGMR
jgi:RNA polymerase sigma factor (sigma-70 family)